MPEKNDDSQANSQVSIKSMFWWVTLSAFAAGSFSKFPELFNDFSEVPSGPTIGLIVASWFAFLVWHWQQRNYSAIAIHVLVAVVISFMFYIFRMIATDGSAFIVILLATLLSSQAFSILFGLSAVISNAIQRNGKPISFPIYCVLGSTLIVAAICGIGPSMMKGFPDMQYISMGAMIGFWMGIYQATAKSKWLKDCRISGVSMRPIVTVGFLVGFFAPIFFSIANQTIFTGIYYIPVWISPALGFVAALATIVFCKILSVAVGSRPSTQQKQTT